MNVKMQMIEDAAVIYPDKSLVRLTDLARMRRITPMKREDKAALHLLMNSGNIHLEPGFIGPIFKIYGNYLYEIKSDSSLSQNAQPA